MKKVVKEKTVLPETAGTPRRGRAVSLRAFYSLAVLLALVFCLARLVGPSCASAKTLGAVQSRVRENCGSAARQKFHNTVRPAQREHLAFIGQIQWQATTRTHITSGSAGGATAIPARRIEIPSTFQQLVIYPIHPTASHFGRDPPVQLTLNPRYDRNTRYAAAASAFVAAKSETSVQLVHSDGISIFNGTVSGTNLEVHLVDVNPTTLQQGISKQLYQQAIIRAGPGIQSISGEMAGVNAQVLRDLTDQGFTPQEAARWTPAARARAAAGFTQHSYNPVTGVLYSTKP